MGTLATVEPTQTGRLAGLLVGVVLVLAGAILASDRFGLASRLAGTNERYGNALPAWLRAGPGSWNWGTGGWQVFGGFLTRLCRPVHTLTTTRIYGRPV